jgi:AraC-like DNA-binding protein
VSGEIKVWRAVDLEGVELHRGRRVTRRVPPHWHEEYQLCLVQAGSGELGYRGAFHTNPPGSLFVIHPGELHSNRATAASGCDFRTLNVAPERMRQAAGAPRGEPFFPAPVVVEGESLRRFLALHRLLEGPCSRLERDSALLETLGLLVWRHAQHPPVPRPCGREPRAVAEARAYLEAHYAEEVPLARLARVAGLSPSHLSRVFRRAHGLPPHAFQTQLRVVRAAGLLRRGLPLAAVAADTGFADQSHLTRRFKGVVGVTPGAYRGSRNVQDGTGAAR